MMGFMDVFFRGNRVMAVACPGVAAKYPPNCQIRTFDWAVGFDRLYGIM
jgi:hypothetical protein